MSNASFNQLRTPNKLAALVAAGALSGNLLLAACANDDSTAQRSSEPTSTRTSDSATQPVPMPEDCTVKQALKGGDFTVTASFLNRVGSGFQIAEVELRSELPIGIGESWDDKKSSMWDNTAYDGQTKSPEDNQYHYSFSAPLGETADVLHVLGTSESAVSCVAIRQ